MVWNAVMSDNIPLAAKGRFAPPPTLAEPLQRMSVAIQSWPGVIGATHWHLCRLDEVDGVDFYVGTNELGHIHLDGDVHLASSADLREALVSEGLARPFPYYPSWVDTTIHTEQQAKHAEWLFRLNYDRLQGAEIEILRPIIKAYSLTQRQLTLGAGEWLRQPAQNSVKGRRYE